MHVSGRLQFLNRLCNAKIAAVVFWAAICCTLWLALSLLPSCFAIKNWSPVGDTCFGCFRKGYDAYAAYGLLVFLLLQAAIMLQDHLAKSREGYIAVTDRDDAELPTQSTQPLSALDVSLIRFSTLPRLYLLRRAILWGARALLIVYYLILLTFLLRLQNKLWLRPCPYSMQAFTAEQQASIGHDPASIYVLFHAEGYPDELREKLWKSKQAYAAAHGYSFVTTKDLFGEWDYRTWHDQLPLMQGNSTFTVAQRSRVWGKTLAIHHVLFEAELTPKPEWVMWIDSDAIIMRPELSAESLMFGVCSRVDAAGLLTTDGTAALRCMHEPEWSEQVHAAAMQSILNGKPSATLMRDTPDLAAVGVNSGSGNNFNSGVMLVKGSPWVKQQLALTWQKAPNPQFDQQSYYVFFNHFKYPSRVKILPGCVGANGYTANWRAGRWMWGDFIAHTIGYDIPANKLHAARGLQEVADGERHPLLLPPWIYTA